MAIRTYAQLQTDYADNAPAGAISAADGRNFIDSVFNWVNNAVPSTSIHYAGDVSIGTNVTPSHKLHIDASSGGNAQGGGILLEDITGAGNGAPVLKLRARRSDANTGRFFGGTLLIDKYRTDAAVPTGSILGSVLFGGNHTNGTVTNIEYAAGIHGVAEGAFNSAADMPTAITFRTGIAGITGGENATEGTERMRIASGGDVTINTGGLTLTAGDLIVGGNRMSLRTVSNSLANNAAGTIGDIALGTDTNKYLYIWYGTNTPSRVQLDTW